MRRFLCCYVMGRKIKLSELRNICPLIYSPNILKGDLGFEPDSIQTAPPPPSRNFSYITARPEMYKRYQEKAQASRAYLKTHSANVEVNGVPQNIDDCIGKYIYLVRNPLDLIPSYAHHMNCSHEETWKRMQIETFMTRRDPQSPCWELVSSWERHTRSWLELARKRPDKLLVVRYEDMKRRPVTVFQNVLKHLELQLDEALFANCLHWSHFETMKAEESAMKDGYRESTNNGPFFRKGEIGNGSKELPQEIQEEVLLAFPDLLKTLGYAA